MILKPKNKASDNKEHNNDTYIHNNDRCYDGKPTETR